MKKCVQLIIVCCVLYHAFAHVPVCFGASGIRSKKEEVGSMQREEDGGWWWWCSIAVIFTGR